MTVLVIFNNDGEVISVLSGDSYYLHSNADTLCYEEGGATYQFSYLKESFYERPYS